MIDCISKIAQNDLGLRRLSLQTLVTILKASQGWLESCQREADVVKNTEN